MPDFDGPLGHRNQTVCLSVALWTVPILTGNLNDFAISLGALLCLWMHADWDVKHRKHGWFNRLMFVDEYAALVPHRHKISHTPILGTLIRFFITYLIPRGMIFILFPKIHFTPWLWRVILGLCIADTLHVVADVVTSWTKRRVKRVRPRRRVWKRKKSPPPSS